MDVLLHDRSGPNHVVNALLRIVAGKASMARHPPASPNASHELRSLTSHCARSEPLKTYPVDTAGWKLVTD